MGRVRPENGPCSRRRFGFSIDGFTPRCWVCWAHGPRRVVDSLRPQLEVDPNGPGVHEECGGEPITWRVLRASRNQTQIQQRRLWSVRLIVLGDGRFCQRTNRKHGKHEPQISSRETHDHPFGYSNVESRPSEGLVGCLLDQSAQRLHDRFRPASPQLSDIIAYAELSINHAACSAVSFLPKCCLFTISCEVVMAG